MLRLATAAQTSAPQISYSNDLTATGSDIQWYAAATGGTALATSTALTDGNTYYATQTTNICESTSRLAVTAIVYPCNSTEDWNGTISTDWNVNANWDGGNVPGSTTAVVIPPSSAMFFINRMFFWKKQEFVKV